MVDQNKGYIDIRRLSIRAGNTFARSLHRYYRTVQRAMEKPESVSVVSEVGGGKRDRAYCAKALMDFWKNLQGLLHDGAANRISPIHQYRRCGGISRST
jgi:hypothetical protein